MPEIVSSIFQLALDEKQRQEVMAAARLILEDLNVLESGRTPLADPLVRLHTLQQKSRELINREDDMNLPYILFAMKVEHAVIRSLYSSADKINAEWSERQKSYHQRLTKTLDNNRPQSLIFVYNHLKAALEDHKNRDLLPTTLRAHVTFVLQRIRRIVVYGT